ncbi:Dipeptidyl aminopeptidase/acylaminoacyl peptidase [Altererythrobacter xiamenensis]|uniref:Dipeptidyl aminopeptidase/acylaminoacyl peptidase n=1 Tax=Altererythrobacter xiamenensis TaxID=1316679 RepID=A0A1Y6ECZ4_9SPHN|nr:prolyl oligopeptidase family serine peptidase [Altererythrobacter xiamenensis]SMQ60405.1 Dipeptidyl aminopeptidase/acylaminoacyl peptidase [Altererythrobacter xiamenensis]
MTFKSFAVRSVSAVALGIATLTVAPVAAQSTAAAEQTNQRVPISEIGTIPNTQQVRISPEGNRLAMTVNNDGQEVYAVLDLDDPNPTPRIFASSGEFMEAGDRTVGFYRWIGNDHVVFQLLSRENIFGQRGDLARLVSFNVNTGKMEPLVWRDSGGNASRILHVNHDTGEFLLERQNLGYESGADQRRPEVVKVDVATGKFERFQRPNLIVNSWYADGDGVVRMGTSYDPDNGESRILYRSGDSGNFRTVQKVVDENFVGEGLQPQIFLDEPDMAIATSNHDGFSKVYKVNLTTGDIVEELFAVEGYDVGGAISNRDNNELIGVNYTTDRSRVKYFDPTMKTIQEQILDASFGKDNGRIISMSEDRTKLVLYVAKPNQPGGFYYYNTQNGDFKQVGWINNALKDAELHPVKMIRYPASDGETIEAAVTMPRHRLGQKNLPVVMITHGGPFGPRDNAEYEPWAQSMAEQGYVVVQPNYRGSGGYGTEWIKKGRDDGFGMRMQDDLNDAIDYLASQGIVDANRACMMGWSYGGYASARAAQRDPNRWQCTVAGAGVYDLGLMRRYDVGYLGKFGSNYLAKGAADLDSVSPAANTDGDWAPIMIVHGVRDARVPVEQARVLVSNLKSSGKVEGKDFIYLEQEKNTHNLPYDYTRIEWLGGAAAWLEKHNPAYVSSDPDYASKPPLDPSTIKMAKELNIDL